MLGFSLVVGDSEASLLETAIVIFSLANMLQWCFFIMVIFLKLHNKKENALNRKKTHSHNTHRKGR